MNRARLSGCRWLAFALLPIAAGTTGAAPPAPPAAAPLAPPAAAASAARPAAGTSAPRSAPGASAPRPAPAASAARSTAKLTLKIFVGEAQARKPIQKGTRLHFTSLELDLNTDAAGKATVPKFPWGDHTLKVIGRIPCQVAIRVSGKAAVELSVLADQPDGQCRLLPLSAPAPTPAAAAASPDTARAAPRPSAI